MKKYVKKYGNLESVGVTNGEASEDKKENGEAKSDAGSELSDTSDLENLNNDDEDNMDDEEEKEVDVEDG